MPPTQTTEEPLLSKDEVEAIGIENFQNESEVDSQRASNPNSDYQNYYQLSLIVSGWYNNVSSGTSYNVLGTAIWNQKSGIFYDEEENPAVGPDFMGFLWSGGFSATDFSADANDKDGNDVWIGVSQSLPNAGRIWMFEESQFKEHYLNYTSNANVRATLTKNRLTGYGNTAEVVLTYIHTYQKTVGSITIAASSLENVLPSVSLSSTAKQWTISCTLTGIPY